jgi:hypothetical protein
MITGIRDLDRKILEYVDEDDYAALLLSCKYISNLFDEIFFRNRLIKKFRIFRKTETKHTFGNSALETKRYYNIISRLNRIHLLLSSNKRLGLQCENCDMILKGKGIINQAYTSIQYSLERDEMFLYIALGYETVLFTTNISFTACSKGIDFIFEVKNIRIEPYFYNWADQKIYNLYVITKNDILIDRH